MSQWINYEPDDPLGPTQSELEARRRWQRTVAILVVAVLLAAALVIFQPWSNERRWAISDQLTIWNNPTPAAVAAFADTTGMSDEGRRIYLASRPELDSAEAFTGDCAVAEVIVLGCYADGRIYIFEVTDERLQGTNEVTAAHEMLHAAYERLGPDDRQRVDNLINDYVAKLPAGDPLFDVLSSYAESQHVNELHSRLGTEVAKLPTELQRYYARYFADRGAVVALHEAATKLLNETNARIAQLNAEIDGRNAALAARQGAWESASDELESDIASFNAKAESGSFTSKDDYDRVRSNLEDRIAANETERQAINADVDAYNALVTELNALGETSKGLYASLDSRGQIDVDG